MAYVPDADLSRSVPGFAELVAYCNGGWPCFHDSEILSLHLNRTGISKLAIDLLHSGVFPPEYKQNAIAANHHLCFTPREPIVITFELEEIDELELNGFSHQNVIGDLSLEPAKLGFLLKLWPCCGLSGWLHAGKVRVKYEPAR